MNEDETKLQLKPKWTHIGVEKIRTREMAYFSATFNLKAKVLLGGTLTNWPATRDKKEKILLAPIELTKEKIGIIQQIIREEIHEQLSKFFGADDPDEGVQNMGKTKVQDLTPEERAELGQEFIMSQLSSENTDIVDLNAYIDEKAEMIASQKVQAKLDQARKDSEIVSFVKDVTGGTDENPVGLPIQDEELEDFLKSLDDDQRTTAMSILTRIFESGMIAFKENGHNKDVEPKEELPEEYQKSLDSGELKVEDLASNTMALGDLDKYDLSKWQGKEK